MAIYKAKESVAGDATQKIITHSLNNAAAVLTACIPDGWPGEPYVTAQDANTITVDFTQQALPGGGLLHVRVET